MSSLVIVAIPSEDDYVNKISSEKVPHLTLLFLGDDVTKVKNLDKIIGFVEHAANTSLRRFGLEVDRRGVLGPEEADVLFFSTSIWSGLEEIKKYRAYLLQEPNIRTAYDSATQFSEWQPHLTLGYPATPAKPDERDYPGITYVNFDRIAVWYGDYEGVEFPLKSYNWDMNIAMSSLTHISEKPWSDFSEADYTLEQWHAACLIHQHDGPPTSKSECKLPVKTPGGALNRNGVHAAAAALAGARSPIKASAEQKAKAATALRGYYKQLDEDPPDSLKQSAIVEDFLEHIGVKGMRWGIRKEEASGGLSRRQVKKVAKEDKKFEKRASNFNTKIELHNSIHEPMTSHLEKLNSKHAKLFDEIESGKKTMDSPEYQKYMSDVRVTYIKELNKAAAKLGTNASGTKIYTVVSNENDSLGFTITTRDIKHANGDSFRVVFVKDKLGRILDLKLAENSLTQSALDDVLAHYGIRGMKWGIRRKATVGPQEVIVRDNRRKIRTSGGSGLPAHPDAVRARKIAQIVKKSGTKAVSNQDLQAYANRLQLEQNISRLTTQQKSPGAKASKFILNRAGNKAVDEVLNESTKLVRKNLSRLL